MKPGCGDLILALKSPEAMPGFSPTQWDRLIPQARAAGLLGRLGALAQRNGQEGRLPVPVWRALEADLAFAERQAIAVHYELTKLDAALADLGVPALVLKGAAYVAGRLAASDGRLMSDIDILVPKTAIPRVESALMLAGWITGHLDVYDQRYYRQWMHEIPPMQQVRRGTILDVHHNLLPETARIRTRPELVIASAEPLSGLRHLRIPSENDLILHSATHLMHEGEWEHGLRDLSDLYALISAGITSNKEFWPGLADRALELGLERPLHHALTQLTRVFDLDVPPLPLPRPGALVNHVISTLLAGGLSSYHSDCRLPLTSAAQFLLYVRSHWLRMPLHLLVPHLLHKAFKPESSVGK